MMGKVHALSGTAAYLGVLPFLPGQHPAPAIALGAIAGAGAAMLPDLDHHSATIAHCYGPPTRLLAKMVEKVSGGHRNGTHSWAGVAAFTGVAIAAQHAGGWPLLVWLALLLGVGITALGLAPTRNPIAYAAVVGAGLLALTGSTVWRDIPTDTIPWAVAIGAVAHIAGDMLTPEGCPLLWLPKWLPLPAAVRKITRYRFGIGLVKTQGPIEGFIVAPALAVLVGWLAVSRAGLWPDVVHLAHTLTST